MRCLTTKRFVRHSSAVRGLGVVRLPSFKWIVHELQVEEESQHERTDRSDRHDPGILEELGSSVWWKKDGQFVREAQSRQKEGHGESRRAEKSGKEVRQKGSKEEVVRTLCEDNLECGVAQLSARVARLCADSGGE